MKPGAPPREILTYYGESYTATLTKESRLRDALKKRKNSNQNRVCSHACLCVFGKRSQARVLKKCREARLALAGQQQR